MKKELTVRIKLKDATKETIIPAMEALKGSTGWQFIQQILDENIDKTKKDILYDTAKWDSETLSVYRRSLIFMELLIELPDKIIEKYSTEPEKTSSIELDPYKDA